MDFLGPVKKFDEYQGQHKWLAIPVAVVKKFGDDGASNQAALVAYFAFFSLFPLLLVFVTILGFVLHGDLSAQKSVISHLKSQFPALGNQLKLGSIHGSPVALVIGIVTSLLAGMGVTNAAQNALDRVWAVPIKDRANFLSARLRGLALLFLIGGLFIVSTGISGLVSGGLGGPLAAVGGIVVSLLFNVALFGAAFRLMTAGDVATSDLKVGVLVAAGFWEILQVVGGYYIGHVLKHTSPSLSSVSFVIGFLVFFHLGAQLTLYAAEINVVIARGLWPRRFFGPPEMPADEETLTALAKVEERSDVQTVEVHFDEEPAGEDGPADGAEAGSEADPGDATRNEAAPSPASATAAAARPPAAAARPPTAAARPPAAAARPDRTTTLPDAEPSRDLPAPAGPEELIRWSPRPGTSRTEPDRSGSR